MKIVVLDGYTLNPGDLSWDDLRSAGEVTLYERTPVDRIVERCEGADVVLTNKTPLTEESLKQLPSLKYIGVLATGFNIVDVAAARKQGIVVTNAPGYSTASVAQLTFSLLLELCYRAGDHSNSVRGGKWAKSADFCFWDYPLIELSGKTIGIIGFGTIGEKVGDIATGFDMKILGNKRSKTDQSHRSNFRWAEIDEILEESDVISLHCPLVPETEGLINRESLKRMKSTAFLLNTARGPIIVEEDLADALNNGVIAGAGLDVLAVEPPRPDHPLYTAKNCIITPHIGWATQEARKRLMDIVVQNLLSWREGSPENVVN